MNLKKGEPHERSEPIYGADPGGEALVSGERAGSVPETAGNE